MSRLSDIITLLACQHRSEVQSEAADEHYAEENAEEKLVDACTEHAAKELLRDLRAVPGRDY